MNEEGSKEGDIMKRTICAFAVATMICAATYETCHAAPITYRHSHSYRSRAIIALTGGHKASIIGLFLGPQNAGAFGVTEPVLTA